MNNIPTAEEVLRNHAESWGNIVRSFKIDDLGLPDPSQVLIDASEAISAMKEYANLVREAALKAAYEKTEEDWRNCEDCTQYFPDEESILNSYPKDLIL